MKNILGVLIIFTSLLVASSTVSAEEAFKDIDGHWAEEEILQMANEGIVKGLPGGNFEPNQKISRAEFITILTRVFDFEESKSDFSDVNEGDWYYEYVSKGFNEGIVSGFPNGSFGPKDNVTRQDIAVFIDRTIKKNGDFSKLAKLDFSDKNDVRHYAKDSIRTMVAYNLMQGRGNNKVAPLDNANRAESTVMIYRMKELLSEESTSEEPSEPAPSDPEPSEPEEPSEKHYTEMSLEELKEVYGPYTLVERIDGYAPGVGIVSRDLMDRYYKELHELNWDVADPLTYMEEKEESFKSLNGHYETWYPKYEIISYRGQPFVESPMYEPESILFKRIGGEPADILPTSPDNKGDVLIDLHTYSDGYAIYEHDNTQVGYLDEVMYQKDDVWMVDANSLFNHFGGVEESDGSLSLTFDGNEVVVTSGKETISVNGKNQTLSTAAETKNNDVYVPLREVAHALGLNTRAFKLDINRIEVATYQLENDYVEYQ